MIYLGDHIRVRMRVFGGDDFIVKLGNGAGRPPIACGQMAKLGWSVADGRALDL